MGHIQRDIQPIMRGQRLEQFSCSVYVKPPAIADNPLKSQSGPQGSMRLTPRITVNAALHEG